MIPQNHILGARQSILSDLEVRMIAQPRHENRFPHLLKTLSQGIFAC